jgi:2-phospho-L-lactate guanylyltransferase (CobY/MobA/RfbA family)
MVMLESTSIEELEVVAMDIAVVVAVAIDMEEVVIMPDISIMATDRLRRLVSFRRDRNVVTCSEMHD